ncbi:MAG: hypothetical protein QOH13_307, partial [Thermoleophilaceae bacterium]|nr:hypothetical protein [Thermoleophilaceae bacterium]
MAKGFALLFAAGLLVIAAPAAIAKPPKKAVVTEG